MTPSFGIGYGGSIRSYTPTQNLCPHLKTAQIYIFGIVVRSAGDGWAASCPSLKKYGAFTLGVSREEVLNEMHRVVQQIVEALAREKNPYPRINSGDYLFFLGDLPVLGSTNGRLYQKRSFLRLGFSYRGHTETPQIKLPGGLCDRRSRREERSGRGIHVLCGFRRWGATLQSGLLPLLLSLYQPHQSLKSPESGILLPPIRSISHAMMANQRKTTGQLP